MGVATRQVLNVRLHGERGALADRFQNAEPFRHVVIPDFFSSAFADRMRDEFPPFEDRYALNEMGKVGNKAVRTDVREISPVYRELDAYIQTEGFLELMSEITGIPNLLYDPEYFGGGTHENRDRQALDAHVDFNYHPKTGWHRRLNLIVYLNPEWDESWGGNLDLHSNPWEQADRITTIVPSFNKGVIFETTEGSWHGFSAVRVPENRKDISRKSFAIYLYTKERPPEETAAEHATVYVPPSMPEDVKPGQVLTEPQYQELAGNFIRHRGMLKHLYEREKKFRTQLDSLRESGGEASSEPAPPALKLDSDAASAKATRGWWADGWGSNDVAIKVSAIRPVKSLMLELFSPEQHESVQLLELTAGSWREEAELQPGERRLVEVPLGLEGNASAELTIRARTTLPPNSAGGDKRPLAFKILGAWVEH